MLSLTYLMVLAAILTGTAALPSLPSLNDHPFNSSVNTTSCNGRTYAYRSLAGYGFLPSNSRDKFNDTLGGLGSSIALDRSSWHKLPNGTYTGTLWAMPDRGWNTEGTLNYVPRVHKFSLQFTPSPSASTQNPSPPNLLLKYEDTIRFSAPDGAPCTGLDADAHGAIYFSGFPGLPVATYTGDGFGGPGPGGRRVPVDSEGLVLARDGGFWVSDEYGPFLYHFDARGKMVEAVRPPDAIVPMRNGSTSFSADSPPRYEPDRVVVPGDPEQGRGNNQGFEGLTVSGDGRTLWALLQSAAVQEGGLDDATRGNARLVEWDVAGPRARYVAEYVVPLPTYLTKKGKKKIAAQSEILNVDGKGGQFFVLARDSGAGAGADDTLSRYRHVDVFDLEKATDIKGREFDMVNGSIASAEGVLKEGITPAEYCSFLDFNVNSELGKFGLHNGGERDTGLLNEKWESLAIAPVEPGYGSYSYSGYKGEVYVFSFSDNDFITQDGALKGGQFKYSDESGYNVANQALVFEVKLPG